MVPQGQAHIYSREAIPAQPISFHHSISAANQCLPKVGAPAVGFDCPRINYRRILLAAWSWRCEYPIALLGATWRADGVHLRLRKFALRDQPIAKGLDHWIAA